MTITMPEKVAYIIEQLQEHGFEAYAVGGCVRDALLGRIPQDWDITTSAKPVQVKQIFSRTVDTGIEHGTVTVMLGREGFEVTTYRIDGDYEDNRHPNQVSYTTSLVEDLKRRDFTMNAMAYNYEHGLIDEFQGYEDLQQGIIRCVGDAALRFQEDALRMLRAIRFSAQLGFAIENKTKQAIKQLASNLSYISAERIFMECNKLLLSPWPQKLNLAYELGVTQIILPEYDLAIKHLQPTHGDKSSDFLIKALTTIPVQQLIDEAGKKEALIIRWALLLQLMDGNSKTGTKVLRRMKSDNELITKVQKLQENATYPIPLNPTKMRTLMCLLGKELTALWFFYQFSLHGDEPEETETIKKAVGLYETICSSNQCFCLAMLKVTGKDLIQLGMRPGPEIGVQLHLLLNQVLEHPELNDREKLIELAKRQMKNSMI